MIEENTYRDYWTNVESIGADAVQEAMQHSGDANEALEMVREHIDQSVDGSYWVIYTHAAAKGLIHSDNESAFFDHGMDASGWEDYGTVVTQLMYFALHQDVWDRMPNDWEEQIEAHFE